MLKKIRTKYVVLNAILILFSIGMLYPWLIALSTSLKAPGETLHNQGLIPEQIDIAKFADVFVTANIPRLALNSIIITTVSVVLILLLASLAAYAFARLDFIFKEVLFFTLLTGLMLQSASLMIPLYQVNVALHLLNTHFAMIGPYVALGLPFAVLILRGFFEGLPHELEDAAIIDGASHLRIYWSVMLPLTTPALVTVGIFLGLASWNDFLLPMLFTSTPDMRTLPLGLLTLTQDNIVLRQEHRFALIVMMTLPVVVLFLAMQRQFIQGLTAGAVKE
jgi:raffinose/stachyose/melibiose transport system permease protein